MKLSKLLMHSILFSSLLSVHTVDAQEVPNTLAAGPVFRFRCFASMGNGTTEPLFQGSQRLNICREANGTTSYGTGCDVAHAGVVGRLNDGGHVFILAKFSQLTRSNANVCIIAAGVADPEQTQQVIGASGSGVWGGNNGNYYSCSASGTTLRLGQRSFVLANGGSGLTVCDYQLDYGTN